MKKARILSILIAVALVAVGVTAEAPQPKRFPRIGFLSSRSPDTERNRLAAFQQGLQELGYWNGKNILIEQRYAGGKFDQLPDLGAQLVGLKVDILVAADAYASYAAKTASQTIPVIFTTVADAVTPGLMDVFRGGNATGLSQFSADLAGKQLELLKEIIPQLSRVAILLNTWSPISRISLKDQISLSKMQAVARASRIQLQPDEVVDPSALDRTFLAISKGRAGAVIILSTPLLVGEAQRIAELTTKHQLPAVYSLKEYVDAGGLMSYGVNVDDLFRRAAVYADKILKGAKPADLPVEPPTKFELIINLKAAKQIGLTIPPNVLTRADKVIQ